MAFEPNVVMRLDKTVAQAFVSACIAFAVGWLKINNVLIEDGNNDVDPFACKSSRVERLTRHVANN